MSNKQIKFTIENFAQRYGNAQSEDTWLFPFFQMEFSDEDLVKFTLEFWPRSCIDPVLCLKTKNNRDIPRIPAISMWIEGDERTSNVITGSCSGTNGATHGFIRDFFERSEFDEFKDEKTISIFVKFPFKTKQLGFVPAAEAVQLRYNFDRNSIGTSESFTLPHLHGALFTVCREEDDAVLLNVIKFGEHQKVHVQYELWVEDENGNRSRKYDDFNVFDIDGVRSKRIHRLITDDFSLPSFYVCGNVRACIPVEKSRETRHIDRISALFDDELFGDVEVRVQEKSFTVNRAIISAQSKVLRKKFTYSTKKKDEMEIIEFTESDFAVVEGLFRFIYSNKLDNLDSIALRLLPLADFYEVVDLTKLCAQSVVKNINATNIVESLELAYYLDHLDGFKDDIFQYVRKNKDQLKEHPNSQQFAQEFPQVYHDLLVSVTRKGFFVKDGVFQQVFSLGSDGQKLRLWSDGLDSHALVAGMVEAKCLDKNKITGDCKDLSLVVASNSAEIKATIKIKQGGGKKFRGKITIGSCTISGMFSSDVAVFISAAGDTFNSPINIVANAGGVTLQENSEIPKVVCSTAPFNPNDKGKATTIFGFHIDSTGLVEIDLNPSLQIVASTEDDTNYWLTVGIPVAASLNEGPANEEKAIEKVVVTSMAKKEFNKKPAKAHSWAYAKNAEIARASRNREIARRKSLPERLPLYKIRRRAHSKNSANAMKKMKAAKSKRDESDKKVATAKAKRDSTKKVLERLDKDLNDAKAAFDGKKKVSAEVAALNATTPKVKSKSLKVERTQSETSTAHSISTRPLTSQASTTQATTTRPTTGVTTDFTTDFTTYFTTDVTTDATTDATTTGDTRSNY